MYRITSLHILIVALVTVSFPVHAQDANEGRLLAQNHCAACHAMGADQRKDVADSPPFNLIGRKFDFNLEAIAGQIMKSHPRMNLTISRGPALDIAAYIVSIPK